MVGGDFFTVTSVSDTQVGVLICDVMGHGIPAALITAVQRALVVELQGALRRSGSFSSRELNARLHHFFDPLPSSMFVTGLYLVIDASTGVVRFANAGHPHPLCVSGARNKVRLMGNDMLQPPFALGVIADSVYAVEEDRVEPGDLIFLYTDGLFDLGEGRELSHDDPLFLEMVQACVPGKRAGPFPRRGARAGPARKLSGQDTFSDDVCLLALEVDRLVVYKNLELGT